MESSNLSYRGEGNSSIVFALKEQRQVYRVFKRNKNNKQCENAQQIKAKQENVMAYVKHVMKPSVGAHLIAEGELVSLSDEIIELMKRIQDTPDLRPEHRLESCINSSANLALKLPDFCFVRNSIIKDSHVPTFTIEIKPKHGFLTNDTPSERRICRFCLKQHLKMKIGQTKSISRFCPVDFYSGKRSRMKHALKMLFETPQNNLRVFMNGCVIFSEENQNEEFIFTLHKYFYGPESEEQSCSKSSVLDSLCDVIIECLLLPSYPKSPCDLDLLPRSEKVRLNQNHFQVDQQLHRQQQPSVFRAGGDDLNRVANTTSTFISGSSPDSSPDSGIDLETTDVFTLPTVHDYARLSKANLQHCENSIYCNCDTESLPVGSVLARLQRGQLWGICGIDELYPHYQQLAAVMAADPQVSRKCHNLLDGSYVDYMKPCMAFHDQRLNDIVNKLRKYKIARTLMDSCIMLTLLPLTQSCDPDMFTGHHVIQDRHGNYFQYQITVIDLDPKELIRMEKWKAEEDEIRHLFLEEKTKSTVT